jgi:hypothetical protein
MKYCSRLKRVCVGDEVVFLDTSTSYVCGTVVKIKSVRQVGEAGNVLIETEDGMRQWVLGGNILESIEAAEKQVAYNLKHPLSMRKL